MLLIIVAAVVFAIIGFIAGGEHRKKTAEAAIGSANQEATRIINQAMTTAEQKKKEAILEAKDEIHKQRSETEKDLRERRAEVQRQEHRLIQKEENLDKKIDAIEKKEDILSEKIKVAEAKISEVETMKKSQLEMLEKISGYSKEQAKAYLLEQLEDALDHEKAVRILDYKEKMKDEADALAREYIVTAIQRCAADHAAEATVSVVSLPNDEMKGRIIGREGRNIRAIETITGVDLIIDDTPEAITVSCFDPVRREIARLTLERLIADGRIHPARIEETVEKCRREVEQTIKQTGERAVVDAGVGNLHPELVKLLGRLRYRTSYGQNVLNHSLEVSFISGLLAEELGADVKLAKRAGLLHDIGKAIDHEYEGTHVQLGVEFAKKYKENEQVIHAIQAHHGDVEPKTVVAFIVQAADAISAARPGARRENIENYIKRLEKLEEIATSFDGVDTSFAIQAGREVRILVKPEQVSDDKMVILAHDIAQKIESELEYPGQIKVNVVRESRATDFAK
ncbi:MAG: ribonuclease Y [Clostridia bacterium]|nr:ribonuclease Y [Clostridia bacterium]MBQ2091727.1 ribonuclease Y [Clostridia bacterium]MBQ6752209.1 ribonuclease Y [Clostridia bacterium]MCR4747705.1 ribonuclease Y [Clostridiales bacterium]